MNLRNKLENYLITFNIYLEYDSVGKYTCAILKFNNSNNLIEIPLTAQDLYEGRYEKIIQAIEDSEDYKNVMRNKKLKRING